MISKTTPKNRSLILVAPFLVIACLLIQGCAAIGIAIDQSLVTKIDMDSYDLTLKSNLGLDIPINEKIILNVYAYNEQKYFYRNEKVEVDMPAKRRVIYYPLWYLTEVAALESARSLSSDVQLAREVDKPKKLAEILEWYKDKATVDQKTAYILGLYYHEGSDVRRDYKLAEKWYRKSKLPAAYANMGEMWEDHHKWSPITGYRGTGFHEPDEIKELRNLARGYSAYSSIDTKCKNEKYGALLNLFREEQRKYINTNGHSAYIFHISIDSCNERHPAARILSVTSKAENIPPPTLILINVSHTDGTQFGEFRYGYDDFYTGGREYIFKNLIIVTINELLNDLINSKDFVGHYRSISQ